MVSKNEFCSNWNCRHSSLTDVGPVVRVAPNMLSFNDPSMIPRIYHKNADKSDFWKPGALGKPPAMIQVQNHQEHAAKRKALAPAVSRTL